MREVSCLICLLQVFCGEGEAEERLLWMQREHANGGLHCDTRHHSALVCEDASGAFMRGADIVGFVHPIVVVVRQGCFQQTF